MNQPHRIAPLFTIVPLSAAIGLFLRDDVTG